MDRHFNGPKIKKNYGCEAVQDGKEVAAELDQSIRWVQKWVKRDRDGQEMTDMHRPGRPRTISEEIREEIVELLEDKEVGSLRRAKRKLSQGGMEVGVSTIHGIAKERGKKYKRRRKKPLLTEKQRDARLKFAKREKKKGSEVWKGYVFYDESPFQTFVSPPGQWVDVEAQAETRPRVAHPTQIMVAGAISLVGKIFTHSH